MNGETKCLAVCLFGVAGIIGILAISAGIGIATRPEYGWLFFGGSNLIVAVILLASVIKL